MKVDDVWLGHIEWIDAMSRFLGCAMRLVDGSETVEVDAASATLEGKHETPEQGVSIDFVVKLLSSRKDGGVSVWALVFIFVDRQRVAVRGACCLSAELRDGQWCRKGWEVDELGEWSDLERLD